MKTKKHKTKKEVSEKIGISQSHLVNLLSGKRAITASTAKKIALAYSRPWLSILTFTPKELRGLIWK